MTFTYMLAVSQPQADSFLNEGYDAVAGFAVDATVGQMVTDIPDLMDLLCLRFPNSPFHEDEPIDVIHLVADPFVQARKAVGPLHPESFRGGVIEYPPFDGSGVARGGPIETDLLLVDPCRVTAGSRLYRIYPGNPEPELRGVYHGIAFGWESVATGTFKAGTPSQFLGAVVKRDWGSVPCDVEVEDGAPVALTLVSPKEPEQEGGFEELESGMWAKRVAYEEHMAVHTDLVLGKLSGIPVRLVRAVSVNGELAFQVVSLLTDALYCAGANFQRWSTATFTTLAKLEHITDQKRQEARPVDWEMANRPGVTTATPNRLDASNNTELIQATGSLLIETAPQGWASEWVRVQLVGHSAIYDGMAQLENGRGARLLLVPTAIVHYLRRIKQNRVLDGEEPFISAVVRFDKSGKANLNLNAVQEPNFADDVPNREWKRELVAFPRHADTIPDWLLTRASAHEEDDPELSEPKTGSPFPADLTAGISRGESPDGSVS